MCLVVLAYRCNPRYKLILGANRDEYYSRPSASLACWKDAPNILGGRDLEEGGTWLGVTRAGRFALVTNYREPKGDTRDTLSRGLLVSDYLRGSDTAQTYIENVQSNATNYSAFNLLVGELDRLFYFSNRQGKIVELKSGLHTISNHLLNTPWPKSETAKRGLKSLMDNKLLDTTHVFELLADRSVPQDSNLPDTGIGLDWERKLAPLFIATESYGTRSSWVVFVTYENTITISEKNYDHPEPKPTTHQWNVQANLSK